MLATLLWALSVGLIAGVGLTAVQDWEHPAVFESDEPCNSLASNDDACALHALQYRAIGEVGRNGDLSKDDRQTLHKLAAGLQPEILHTWRKMTELRFYINQASDQAEVTLGLALGRGLTKLLETSSQEWEQTNDRANTGAVPPRIKATLKETNYLQRELNAAWSLLRNISKINDATKSLMSAHRIVNPNAPADKTSKPLEFEQCGGIGYKGSTECEGELECVSKTEWFSVCKRIAEGGADDGDEDDDDDDDNDDGDHGGEEADDEQGHGGETLLEEGHKPKNADEKKLFAKFKTDLEDMRLQVQMINKQLAALHADLDFTETKVGRYTGEAMPCSGTRAAPWDEESCYDGKILLEKIHLVGSRTGYRMNVTGHYDMECESDFVPDASIHQVTEECKGGIAGKVHYSVKYCSDQKELHLSVILPHRKYNITTQLSKSDC